MSQVNIIIQVKFFQPCLILNILCLLAQIHEQLWPGDKGNRESTLVKKFKPEFLFFICSGYTKTLNCPIITLIQLLLNNQQVTLTIKRPAIQYTKKFGSLYISGKLPTYPSPKQNTSFSLRAKFWLKGGVGGQFTQNV